MAMVGTCGFGSLVRLGTGDLRSLIVVLVLGATAYATLRGVFAGFRITALESLSIAMPDGMRVRHGLAFAARAGFDVRGAIASDRGRRRLCCWHSATRGCGARRAC